MATFEEQRAIERKKRLGYIGMAGFVGLIIVCLLVFGWPYYNVWSSEMSGKAAYQKATQDRNIMILEATAREEAARHNYNVTVIDATAHAKSISIIGEELERNKDYLTYMWIQDTGDAGDTSYIYVPSGEFGMPIQEAMRLNKIQKELE